MQYFFGEGDLYGRQYGESRERSRRKEEEGEGVREREARVLALRVAGGQRRNGGERPAGLYGTVLPAGLARVRGWTAVDGSTVP